MKWSWLGNMGHLDGRWWSIPGALFAIFLSTKRNLFIMVWLVGGGVGLCLFFFSFLLEYESGIHGLFIN